MNYMTLLTIFLGLAMVGCKSKTVTTQTPTKSVENLQKSTLSPSATNKQTVVPESTNRVSESVEKTDSPVTVKRTQAAENSPSQAPKLATTFETKMAQKAFDFVDNSWRVAREKGDLEAYSKLLTEDFKGSRLPPSGKAGSPTASAVVQNRDEWLKSLSGSMPSGQSIELGPPSVDVVSGPATRVTFRFPEREATQTQCIVRDRELTVFVWEDKEPLLNNEIEQNASACPNTDAAHIAGVHDALREHVSKYQPLDKYLAEETFWIRDYGIERGKYRGDYLQTTEGKWLLELVEQSEADFDRTRFFGKIGCVRTDRGVTFVYTFANGTWKLLGLSRPQ